MGPVESARSPAVHATAPVPAVVVPRTPSVDMLPIPPNTIQESIGTGELGLKSASYVYVSKAMEEPAVTVAVSGEITSTAGSPATHVMVPVVSDIPGANVAVTRPVPARERPRFVLGAGPPSTVPIESVPVRSHAAAASPMRLWPES